MTNLQQRLANLSPEQRALLLRKIQEQHNLSDGQGKRPHVQPITTLPRGQTLPLSFAQQRVWFLDQLGSGAAYNLPAILKLSGQLDMDTLQQALSEIVRRHETLRTTFRTIDDEPRQVIHVKNALDLPLVNLQHLPTEAREAGVKALATEDALRPFDLSCDLMLRAKLLQLGPEEHVLLLTMHHIASDGWSLGILVRELTALYAAFSQDKPAPLPELPIQYADFAVWQQQWLQKEILDAQLSYWRDRLAGAPQLLPFPTDRPRPSNQTFRGGLVPISVNAELTRLLHQLSRGAEATLFMTLLAAFQVLLARYSGQDDIVVGSPIANRNRTEIEALIGFFVNTLVLRADMSSNPSFLELLAQVRQTTQAAYDHQDLPFERLVEELQPERTLNHNPLVQVLFTLHNELPETLDLPGLRVTRIDLEFQNVRMDLELHLQEVGGALEGYCIYNTDLFDVTTIERMIGHFQNLLAGIITAPQQRVFDLPLLSEAERHQILIEWNDTTTDYPRTHCIHTLFEAQAERTPDAVAVVFPATIQKVWRDGRSEAAEDQYLTYRQLNVRANQLAHHLQLLGVEPGTPVGICVERSIEMIVGILGILKVGGAYVPLDPTYPTDRLAFMVEDSQTPVLVMQQQFADKFLTSPASQVYIDADWNAIALQPETKTVSAVDPAQPAYVMYTSGSTGKAKGVTIPHRAISRLVFNTNYIDITPADRIAQASNASFDAATFEIWGALLHGAILVGVPREIMLSPHQFAAYLHQHRISILFLTTALFNQVVQSVPNAFQSLRCLLFGGEAVDPTPVRTVLQNGSPQILLHVYGPTESTTFTSWYRVKNIPADAITVPIGRPISNTTIHLLDRYLQPVPIGAPGELYIGGDGLALGYYNRPALTAEKFIPNPFREGRLYKTGDVVRYLPDGNIEFLGRIDHQVKLRGFRIELGEIESILAQHPSVQETVVVMHEEQPDDKRLVAYLMPTEVNEAAQMEFVSLWQNLYEETYGQPSLQNDVSFNLSGWNSSYTGLPLPETEMQEWVEHTVAEIRALKPDRVLEIGCGTGLLLSRLASECTTYWGTDYSQAALQHIQKLKQASTDLGHVTLLDCMADDFTDIPSGAFDVVILNSIVQYFPGVDYLRRVLAGAAKAVKPGGFIYVGDVRNYALSMAYQVSVQLYQATDEVTRRQFEQQVQQRLLDEEELLIDPTFFYTLKDDLLPIEQVWISLKRGHYHNELTRFRYQVVLQVGPTDARPAENGQPQAAVDWLEWQQAGFTVATLRQQLAEQQPQKLGLRRVPNARLQTEMKTLAWLADAQEQAVGQLRRHLTGIDQGVDPEELWALGEALPYTVHISWSAYAPGAMDVLFSRQTTNSRIMLNTMPAPEQSPRSWPAYGNNPLLGKLYRTLIPQVREYLQSKLPDYMVPSAFMILDALPLTPNGKIDRRTLPSPVVLRSAISNNFIPPGTATEESVARIWSEILGLDQVGIHDDFFDLGGHSLLATQVISRVREAFSVTIPLRDLFERPTVAGLAERLDALKAAQAMSPDEQMISNEDEEEEVW